MLISPLSNNMNGIVVGNSSASSAAKSATQAFDTSTINPYASSYPTGSTQPTTPQTGATGQQPSQSLEQNLLNIVQLIMSTVMMLLQSKLGANGSSPTHGVTSGSPPAAVGNQTGATGANNPDLAARLDKAIVGGTPEQKAQLKQTMLQISNDPEGSKLLNAALDKGTTYSVGDPKAAAAGAADQDDGDGSVTYGVTITENGHNHVVLRDPNKKDTINHENVHVVTDHDGNSKLEEAVAKYKGNEIQARLDGQPVTQSLNSFQNQVNSIEDYQSLPNNNGIIQDLANLGVAV